MSQESEPFISKTHDKDAQLSALDISGSILHKEINDRLEPDLKHVEEIHKQIDLINGKDQEIIQRD